MEVQFGDDDLDKLETDTDARSKWDEGIVKSFREVMRLIRDAIDERDIRNVLGSKNLYSLHGDRDHQHAIRLNRQWRLIIEIRKGTPKNSIYIVAIEDYH